MSWQTVKASELIVKRGGSVNPSTFPDETFELFSIPAFDAGVPEISIGSEIGSSKSCIQPNDVLLSKIVPHIRRCWVVTDKKDYRQIGSGEWIIFRDERFYPKFLKYFLTSDGFHHQFMNTVAGVGGSLVRARPAFVEKIEIPLPPLDEQKRIAAMLDKADAIRQKRKQAIALADEFLRSVFLDMFGDPLANPKNHTVRNLGELCNLITDGKHGDCEDEENSGYFFVSAKNVRNGELCLDGSRQINKKEFLEVHKRTCLEPGALLLVNTGATIGKVAILPQSEIVSRCTLQKSVAVIKPKKEILNNEFLMKIIQLRVNDFASKGSGSAIKNLLLSQIREFPIILPSIELQEKYAVIAKNVKENKVHQKESGLALNDFFNSLSQKAFSGQL